MPARAQEHMTITTELPVIINSLIFDPGSVPEFIFHCLTVISQKPHVPHGLCDQESQSVSLTPLCLSGREKESEGEEDREVHTKFLTFLTSYLKSKLYFYPRWGCGVQVGFHHFSQ